MEELKNDRFDEALELDDDDKTLSSTELEKPSNEEPGTSVGSHQSLRSDEYVKSPSSGTKDEMNDTPDEIRVQNNFFDVAFDAVDDITSESSGGETDSKSTVDTQAESLENQIKNGRQETSTSVALSSSSKKAMTEDKKSFEDVNIPVTRKTDDDKFNEVNVSPDVKELFKYIQLYRPHDVELESTLKCFIPSYIPAIGSPDPFIKPIRPDGKPETLGLKVIDEPSFNQSDTAVLELQLKSISKKRRANDIVHCIENAEENKHLVDNWIKSIQELHGTINTEGAYQDTSNLLNLENVIPEDILEHLREGTVVLPPPEIDLSLENYAQALCLILDIPVRESDIISSVHSLISLCANNCD